MSQTTPLSSSSAQFPSTRERKSSVANSVKFNHTRSSSKSSIDDELFQPPSRIANRERGSFDSLSSNRASLLDEIDSPQRQTHPSLQHKLSSLFFKNVNGSSSTLLPLTRTVSFNSVHRADSSGSSPIDSNHSTQSTETSHGLNAVNRLSRLFGARNKNSSSDTKPSSRPSSSRPSLTLSSEKSNNFNKSKAKPTLLQRQISLTRSIKDKRNLKKPVDLSIQTNFTFSPSSATDIKDGETVISLPNLTEALGSATSMTSPQILANSTLNNSSKSHKHHLHLNHHNLLRPRNKDNPLSSSSSNSKLISDKGETLYSFSMTGGNLSTSDLQKTFQQLELLNFKDLDSFPEKDVMGDECYSLLTFLVLPIFKGEPLKLPIEDVNRLVELFLYLRVQDSHSTSTPTKTMAGSSWSSRYTVSVFDEIQMLIEQGFLLFNRVFISTLTNISTESKVIRAWTIFKSKVFYYLEGIFLPVQLELQGLGPLTKFDGFLQVWREIAAQQDFSELYIKRLILLGFRDSVIIPIYESEEEENWIHDDDTNSDYKLKADENVSILQQCFSMLQSVESKDSSQNLIERLLKDIISV